MNTPFSFNVDEFNKIFPFYILVEKDLSIKCIGISLKKLFNNEIAGLNFVDVFEFQRPHFESLSKSNFKQTLNQLVIFFPKNDSSISLRGQFNILDNGFLFVGTPWFSNIQDVVNKNLTLHDFAFHDPLLDLLHVLKNQEIHNEELKELLQTVNSQRKNLKKDKEELQRLSVVASANKNAVVFTKPNGEIYWCNDAYLSFTGFSREEIYGKTPVEIGLNKDSNRDEINKMITAFSKDEPFDVEILHNTKSGKTFWSRTKGQSIKDNVGKTSLYFAMIEDITQDKLKEERLSILSSIADVNINAVIICDKNGYIEWVNNSFEKVTGYKLAEILGKKPGWFLQGEETNQETVKYLADQIKLGEPFNCEILNYSKTKKKYWVRIQGQALKNNNGEIIKYFAIEEDISLQKKLENQKEQLLIKLEKQNDQLNNYAQVVSHDLKSPLRSIHALINWIKEDSTNFTEETSEYLNLIELKVEKMDHLINGILNYSKVEEEDLTQDDVKVESVIQNIIVSLHIPPHISVVVSDHLPIIKANSFKIQQLFQNIIANAILYNDKAQGLIDISCEQSTNDYLFKIKDNGPGIAKENQEKIFQVFQSFSNHQMSTGIGLSIVKRIVDNYNGSIWVESELNVGTTFFINLPKNIKNQNI